MLKMIKHHKWPLVIFLAAFFIRLVYLIQSKSNPAFYYPMVDELWHLNWAKEIIGGNFWGNDAYFRGPLYPYFLALLLKITGGDLFWSRLLQLLFGAGSAVLVFKIGQRLFSKKAAILAGFMFALYGTMIFYEAMLLIPVLFVFLNLLAVHLLLCYKDSERFRHWWLAGFVLGLAAIARPNVLLLAPLFMLWIYLAAVKPRSRPAAFRALIFLVGVMIPVLSVTLRNYIITGEPVLISSQGGVNLYIGNNPDTDGLTMLMPELQLDESLPWTEFTSATRRVAETESHRTLTAAEESSFWTRKAIAFIVSNPGKFIEITFKKTVYFFLGFENSDQTDIYFSRTYSSLYSLLLWHFIIYFPFGLLMPLALVGMIHAWKERNKLILLYLFVIGYLPTVVLFLVTARHRLPVIPFLILFATVAIFAFFDWYRGKNFKNIIIYGIILLGALILCNRTYFEIGFESTAQIHFNLALTYDRQGDLVKAEQEYIKALDSDPSSVVTLNNLGYVQYRLGKMNEALSNFHQAIRYDPGFADAYNNIGLVHESRNDLENAEKFYQRALGKNPELYQTHLNLGDVYLARQDYLRAEVAYRQAWIVDTTRIDALTKLGGLYARQRQFDKANEMFDRAARKGTLSAVDYTNWGNVYYATSQAEPAITMYRRAITADSNFARVYFNLAAAFQRFGYPADSARRYAQKALQLDPSLAPARELLNNLR